MAARARTFHKAEEAAEALNETEERDSLPRVNYLLMVLIPFKKNSFYADIMIDVQTRNYRTLMERPFYSSLMVYVRRKTVKEFYSRQIFLQFVIIVCAMTS